MQRQGSVQQFVTAGVGVSTLCRHVADTPAGLLCFSQVHLELEQSEAGDANPEGDVQVALKMQEFTKHMNKAYVEDMT
jgi:hypothetical protein